MKKLFLILTDSNLTFISYSFAAGSSRDGSKWW